MALCLRFYIHDGRLHDGQLLRDWLFETARACGIPGGTAFRAAAGYGRHGVHEDHFFELAGDLPESVEFFAEEAQIRALLERVARAGLALLHVSHEVAVGMTRPAQN